MSSQAGGPGDPSAAISVEGTSSLRSMTDDLEALRAGIEPAMRDLRALAIVALAGFVIGGLAASVLRIGGIAAVVFWPVLGGAAGLAAGCRVSRRAATSAGALRASVQAVRGTEGPGAVRRLAAGAAVGLAIGLPSATIDFALAVAVGVALLTPMVRIVPGALSRGRLTMAGATVIMLGLAGGLAVSAMLPWVIALRPVGCDQRVARSLASRRDTGWRGRRGRRGGHGSHRSRPRVDVWRDERRPGGRRGPDGQGAGQKVVRGIRSNGGQGRTRDDRRERQGQVPGR